MTKATYRRRVLFSLWFQREKVFVVVGMVAALKHGGLMQQAEHSHLQPQAGCRDSKL